MFSSSKSSSLQEKSCSKQIQPNHGDTRAHDNSSVLPPCSFFLSNESDPRLKSHSSFESLGSNIPSPVPHQAIPLNNLESSPIHRLDDNTMLPTRSYPHISPLINSVISTDDDSELSSPSGSACSLDDVRNGQNVSFDSKIKASFSSPERINRRQFCHPSPTPSGTSSVFTDGFDYSDIGTASFEHLPSFDTHNFERDQSHMPSSSISNSATFARALKQNPLPKSKPHNSFHLQPPNADSSNVTPKSSHVLTDNSINPSRGTSHKSTSVFASPQLIMPRVSLPSRRPFTADGLALGKLKILVSGDSGTGKSMLIKAIAQSSKNIVYIDDTPHYVQDNTALWEHAASTKPCLSFDESSDSDDFGISDQDASYGDYYDTIYTNSRQKLRRPTVTQYTAMSSDSSTFEKNVYFVDTLGYGSFTDASKCIQQVVSYLDDAFQKTSHLINANNSEAVSLLTSTSSINSVPIVDVCLYIITHKLKPVDLEYIRQISQYAPVIPVITRSDLLPQKEILTLKLSILQTLKQAQVVPFLFETSIDEAIELAKTNLIDFINDSNKRNSSVSSVWTMRPDQSFYKQSKPEFQFESEPKSSFSNHSESQKYYNVENEGVLDSDSSIEPTPDKVPQPMFVFPCAVSSVSETNEALFSVNESTVLIDSNLSFAPSGPRSILNDKNSEPVCLFPSELDQLCKHLFSSYGATWLRHSSAKRFLDWAQKQQQHNCIQKHIEYQQVSDQLWLANTVNYNHDTGTQEPARTIIVRDARSEVSNFKIFNSWIPYQKSQKNATNLDTNLQQYDEFMDILEFEALININDVVTESRKRAQRLTSKWVMDVAQSDGASCFAIPYRPPKPNQGHLKPDTKGKKTYNGYNGNRYRQEWQLIPIFSINTPRPVKNFADMDRPGGLCQKPLSKYEKGREELRNKHQARKLGTSRKFPKAPITKYSSSIIEVDPLNIWGISVKLWNFIVQAIGVTLGLRLLIEIVSHVFNVQVVSTSSQLLAHTTGLFRCVSSFASTTFSFAISKVERLVNLLSGPARQLATSLVSPFIAPAEIFLFPDQFLQFDEPGTLVPGGADDAHFLQTRSVLSAFFSGDLEDNVIVLLVDKLKSGFSRLL